MVRRGDAVTRRSRPAGAQRSSVRFFRWFRCPSPPANFLRASGTTGTRGRERGRDRTNMSKLQRQAGSLPHMAGAGCGCARLLSGIAGDDRPRSRLAEILRGQFLRPHPLRVLTLRPGKCY